MRGGKNKTTSPRSAGEAVPDDMARDSRRILALKPDGYSKTETTSADGRRGDLLAVRPVRAGLMDRDVMLSLGLAGSHDR